MRSKSAATPTATSRLSGRTEERGAASALEIAREHQCPFREKSQCLYLNGLLGWPHGYSLEDCDACWALGSVSSPEGLDHLHGVASHVVTEFSTPARISKLPRGVLVALTVKHASIDLDTFRVEASRASKARVIAPLWQRATSLVKALSSKFTSTLPPHDYALRHISCFGTTPDGVRVANPCPSLQESAGHFYCGACGCGTKWWAALDTLKLSFPELPCPRERPGFTPCSTSSTTAEAAATPPSAPATPGPSV